MAPAPTAAQGSDAALPTYVPHRRVSGRLRFSGGATMRDLVAAWGRAFSVVQPGASVEVDRDATLSAQGVTALLAGRADVVTFVREPFPSESAAIERRFGRSPVLVEVAGGSYATRGGTHALAVYVNAANPLARLTLAQFDAIYSKERRRGAPAAIERWGQLGLTGEWAQRPVHAYGMLHVRTTGNPPGIVNYLQQRILRGGTMRAGIREQADRPGETALQAIVHRVAEDPLGIGYSGFAYKVPGTKILALAEDAEGPFYAGTPAEVARREYPLSRSIYLGFVPPRDGPIPPLLQEFIAFVLGREGQHIVARDRMRFLPLSAGRAAASWRAFTGAPAAGEERPPAVDPALPHYVPQAVAVPADAPFRTASGAIRIVGYNDMRDLLESLVKLFSASHPGLRFELDLPGTRAAPPALAFGTSAFAPMGAEFTPLQLVNYRAATAGAAPLGFRIAHASLDPRALSGPLGVIVPNENPLHAITLPQLAAVYTGKATHWRDLGLDGEWKDRAIHAYGLDPDTPLELFFAAHTIGDTEYGDSVTHFHQSRDVVAHVASDPLAIGFAAANRATTSLHLLPVSPGADSPAVAPTEQNIRNGSYPLDRYLMIYVRTPPSPLASEFLRLALSFEGQQAVASTPQHYLPLTTAQAARERANLSAAARVR